MVIHETIYRLQTTCSLSTMERFLCDTTTQCTPQPVESQVRLPFRTEHIRFCAVIAWLLLLQAIDWSSAHVKPTSIALFHSRPLARLPAHRLSEIYFSISDKIRYAKTSFCAQSSTLSASDDVVWVVRAVFHDKIFIVNARNAGNSLAIISIYIVRAAEHIVTTNRYHRQHTHTHTHTCEAKRWQGNGRSTSVSRQSLLLFR